MADANEPIAKAVRRLAVLRAEARQIETFLSLYEQFSGLDAGSLSAQVEEAPTPPAQRYVHAVSLSLPAASETQYEAAANPAPEPHSPSVSIPQREFTELARKIILASGRPMASHRLLEGFSEMGRRVGGKDELRNLTTKLWRAGDEIIKIPGAGYWPRDLPCPSVSYVPLRSSVADAPAKSTDTLEETSEHTEGEPSEDLPSWWGGDNEPPDPDYEPPNWEPEEPGEEVH